MKIEDHAKKVLSIQMFHRNTRKIWGNFDLNKNFYSEWKKYQGKNKLEE